MRAKKKDLRAAPENPPRRWRLSFPCLVTIALLMIVLLVSIKYYGQVMGAVADPDYEIGPDSLAVGSK